MGENLQGRIKKYYRERLKKIYCSTRKNIPLKLPIHSKTYSSDVNSTSDYTRIPPRTGLEPWLTVRKPIISPILSPTLLQIYCIRLIEPISYSFWVWLWPYKYILNMGGLVGRVGFGGFVILWPKPNSSRYKKKFCNPTHKALKTDPTWRVRLDRVGFGGSVGFLHTPIYLRVSSSRSYSNVTRIILYTWYIIVHKNDQFFSFLFLCCIKKQEENTCTLCLLVCVTSWIIK